MFENRLGILHAKESEKNLKRILGHLVILFNASPKLEVIAAVGGRHYVKGAASQWALGLESQDLSILPKCSCL